MKCIKHKETGEIRRETDKNADSAIKTNRWEFCAKSEWKKAVRK